MTWKCTTRIKKSNGRYKRDLEMREKILNTPDKHFGLRPGESFFKIITGRLFLPGLFLMQTQSQFKAWDKFNTHSINKYGVGIESYFFNPETKRVNYEKMITTVDFMIQKGIGKHGKSVQRAFQSKKNHALHPYFTDRKQAVEDMKARCGALCDFEMSEIEDDD